jgi:plastocyanin
MTTRRWTGLAVLALTVVLLAAACGSKGATGAGSGGSANAKSSKYSGGGGRYGYGGGTKSSGGASKSGGKAALTVEQTNTYTFDPTTVKVKGGSTIAVQDIAGQIPHNFSVQGQSIDVTNNPGQTQDVKITLEPGTYQFFCKFHGSPGQGMHGTLVVT